MSELFTTIEGWSHVWGQALWRATWQGGIALAAAAMVVAWGRRLSPRVICWIWRLACLKLLVACLWFAPLQLAWLPAPERTAPAAAPPLAAAEPAEASAARETPAAAAPLPATLARPFPGMSLLLAVWVCGVGVRLAGTVRQVGALRALRRTIAPVTHASVREYYADEAGQLGVRRLPDLCESQAIASPLLLGPGVLRPAQILLPVNAAADYSEAELRMMLAHELAHHRRRDLLWNWLPTVAGWLFYFHPLVWWMGRRWPEAQEAACDELVLQRRALPPAAYGRLLLRMAMQGSRAYMQTPLAAGVLGGFRDLERRLLALANVHPSSPRALALAVCCLALIAVPGIVPWRLVAQEPAAPPAKKSTQPSAEVQNVAVQADAVFSLAEPLDEPADPKPIEPSAAHRAASTALGKIGAHVSPFAPSGCAVLFGPEWKGTAADVQRLAELDELRFVAVSDCRKLSDADWKAIRGLEGPLGVQLVEADDQDVAALAGWEGCNNVSVISNRLTAASVASIASLPNLVQVLIAGNMVEEDKLPPLDDASLAPLAKCQKLERLILTNFPRITGTGLQALAGLPKLIALNLMQVALTDAGLAAICQLPHLEQLSLTMPEVTAAGYASLSQATRLTHLTLWDAKNFSGPSAATLAPLDRLQMLSIDGT
ncbi:MAG: hypothetical protein JNG90_03915, partial [Planctomycetaceae bacterium]|nr:hypothetical protein [Planctomycetaceae bacterium]